MNILRAKHLGMCFGVRDAIGLAHAKAEVAPITILGDLVHNESVVHALRAKGVQIQSRALDVNTPTVMVTAHGTSERTLQQLRQQQREIIEATCPLVHFAHRALTTLVQEGYHPVIVGQRDHVEVRGMTDDLEVFDVVLTEADLSHVTERSRFGVVAQTTQPIERVRHLVHLLGQRFPQSEVRFSDTVCQPTKQRQHAAVELASQCDVVVVVGGAASNNTRELVATSRQFCSRVHHVQTAADLRAEWFESTDAVGLTAGTSTPDTIIDAVESWLQRLASAAPGSTPPGATEIRAAGTVDPQANGILQNV